ncbi:MAG: DUF4384 domain-containing protein [Desulfomonile tiedjei]|nr:DUF4384 domain-containing protein [Desulfomonile tiedjei]
MVIDSSFRGACSVLFAVTFALAGASALLAATNNTPFEIKTQFFYKDDGKEIKPLDNNSVLKSGQNVGVVFQSKENCFVYIFWKDSTGNVGTLFPNPGLTAEIPQVMAGKTYWLPHQDGDRWYILDDTPGTEVLYFVASRTRNSRLEQLSKALLATSSGTQANSGEKGVAPSQATQPANQATAREMERELSTMGFAQYSVPKGVEKASFASKEEMFKNLEGVIRVSGAEALIKIEFKHIPN